MAKKPLLDIAINQTEINDLSHDEIFKYLDVELTDFFTIKEPNEGWLDQLIGVIAYFWDHGFYHKI